MKATTRLRRLIAGPEILVAPGAYEGITARLVEQEGFSALYMTGAGTSASFGLPDHGLLTLPGVLLKTVYGACDAALAALKETHRHPTPLYDGNVRDAFRRFGADEWDSLRARFRDAPAPAAE